MLTNHQMDSFLLLINQCLMRNFFGGAVFLFHKFLNDKATKEQLNSKFLQTSTQGHLQECSEPVRQLSGAVQCQVPENQASSTSQRASALPPPALCTPHLVHSGQTVPPG